MTNDFSKNHEDAPPVAKNYITRQGYERLRAEWMRLIDDERPKVVEVVHWAAGNGDRSENGDYLYGKKRLREIDRRIRFLTKRLEIAEIVDSSVHKGSDKVFFGANVTYMRPSGEEVTVQASGDAPAQFAGDFTATMWSEKTDLTGATAIASYTSGDLAGNPAITRNAYGTGHAWYVATRLGEQGLSALFDTILAEAGITTDVTGAPITRGVADGLEIVRRTLPGSEQSFLFLLNHATEDRTAQATGTDLVTGATAAGSITVPAGGIAVVAEG